ncbi:ParA family protein [Alicyclobacillus acidocaldarius]|nr:ParA family protein [Alicyclobacillus acidocaldarius]
MWLVFDHDPVRGERLKRYLERQGIAVHVVSNEDAMPGHTRSFTLALFLDTWNEATVRRVKEQLGLSVLYCTIDTITRERYAELCQAGYDDVVPYPPAPDYVRHWERKADEDQGRVTLESLVSRPRKSSYTDFRETKPFEHLSIAPRRAKVICVTGVKGGVGKTTLSALMASALMVKGRRVVLAELDPNGNLAGLFRTDRTVTADRFETLPDALTDPELEQNMMRTAGGWWLIPKGERPLGLSRDGAERLIHLTGQYADYVVLDTHASQLISTVVALQEADVVLGVTTPDRTTWTDLRPFLQQGERPAYLILNRVRERPRRAADIVAFLEREIGYRVVGVVREDDGMYKRVQQGLAPMGSRKTNAEIQRILRAVSVLDTSTKSK